MYWCLTKQCSTSACSSTDSAQQLEPGDSRPPQLKRKRKRMKEEEEEVSCLDELSDGSLDCGQEEGDESSTSVQRRRTISQKRESLCISCLLLFWIIHA